MGNVWNVLALSIGGALGVNARYAVNAWATRWAGAHFPWGIFLVNVSGSFAIGLLAPFLARAWPHPLARAFLVVGFLGGYTTFSTFVLDTVLLAERRAFGHAVCNLAGSVAAGVLAVVLGMAIGRNLLPSSPSAGPTAPDLPHTEAQGRGPSNAR